MKVGIKESILSIALFGGVLLALVAVDERVHEQFQTLARGGNGLSYWTAHAASVGDSLLGAARYQSVEHAPLVVFAAVSAVLVLFMVKS